VRDLATGRVLLDNKEHRAVKFLAETPLRVVLDDSALDRPERSDER
jgi:hypothetical protein